MTKDVMWKNAQGHLIPLSQISDSDQMKDELAARLCDEADDLRARIAAFKQRAMNEMFAAKQLIFEKYGAKVGGSKGGFGIRRFDGSAEAEISIAERVSFGPELQAAKAKIDERIEAWAEDGEMDPRIRVLVEHAFQVNKAGRIDTQRVLGLRKLKMVDRQGNSDPGWEQAMDAVTDALIVDGTATYLRFYRRDPETNRRAQISLNFSDL